MFEFFSLQGRVDSVDHVVVRLLLLLLHLGELLEVLLPTASKEKEKLAKKRFYGSTGMAEM